MYSANEQIQKTVDAVREHARGLDRGDVLKFEDIESLAGLKRYEGHWNAIVSKVRRAILLERGIALRPVINVGYKLCTKDEQLKYCARNRQRRAARQLTRGVAEIENLPNEGLTLHQQRLRALTIDNLRLERRIVRRCVREQRGEIKKTDTLPKRPAKAAAK